MLPIVWDRIDKNYVALFPDKSILKPCLFVIAFSKKARSKKQYRNELFIFVGFGWLVDDVWACAITVLSIDVDI